MGEVINLRRARKKLAAAAANHGAEANRARFGRSKAQKMREAAEKIRRETALDGAKRDP